MMAISAILPFLNPWSDTRPAFLTLRSSKLYIILTVSISVFTDIFLYGVIVPVVPFALNERAGVPETETQYWVSVLLAVYGAALLAGSPIAGYITDRTPSRRLPFVSGLVLLAGATVMLCVADSIALFIIGRALQGLSGAIVWVAGLVIIVDTAGQKDVGQYMGYTGLAMSLGVLLAPLLGGVVYDRAGYYAVYAICFALLGLDVFLRLTMIESKMAMHWLQPPQISEGFATVCTEDVAVRDSPKQLHSRQQLSASQTNPSVLPLQAIESEKSTSRASKPHNTLQSQRTMSTLGSNPRGKWHRRLPPIVSLLGSRRLLASLWGSVIQAALLTSLDSTLPLRVRTIFGWNSLGAGLIFVALVIPSFAGPLFGCVSDRYGPKLLATFGFLVGVPCTVLLRFVTHDTSQQKVLLCALLAMLGFSISSVLTPFMAEIGYIVEEKEKKNPGIFGAKGAYAQAYGLFNVAFAAGCLIGPIWGGLVKERAGWGTMVWTLAVLCAFSAFISFGWVGGWVGTVGLTGGGGHSSNVQKGMEKEADVPV